MKVNILDTNFGIAKDALNVKQNLGNLYFNLWKLTYQHKTF